MPRGLSIYAIYLCALELTIPNAERDLETGEVDVEVKAHAGSRVDPDVEAQRMPERYVFKRSSGEKVSPWHDIPYKADGETFNCVIEIPKFTRKKMEVATKEEGNPIIQDAKDDGTLREYAPPIYWNYGMIPQTWEDPDIQDPKLPRIGGDNDPVDIVEIGEKTLKTGDIIQVKVLGALAMIDGGELDWKMIVINAGDSRAGELNDISDVESKMPGVVSGIREWFRWYKKPDGKGLNEFGYSEAALDKNFAIAVIEETHRHWEALRTLAEDHPKGLWVRSPGPNFEPPVPPEGQM